MALVWKGTTIATFFNESAVISPDAELHDVVYPHTRGRQQLNMGSEHSDNQSLIIAFDEDGEYRNRITASSSAAVRTIFATLNVWKRNASTGTLAYGSVTETYMRLMEFRAGTIRRMAWAPSGYEYQAVFSAKWVSIIY